MEHNKKDYLIPLSIVLSALIFSASWIYTDGLKNNGNSSTANTADQIESDNILVEQILPPDGVELPAVWGDLGKRMIAAGVIDAEKFESVYKNRGGLSEEERNLLAGSGNGKLKITESNSGLILNLLWALGLGNKNEILEKGPMTDLRYGGAGNFASTGGGVFAE